MKLMISVATFYAQDATSPQPSDCQHHPLYDACGKAYCHGYEFSTAVNVRSWVNIQAHMSTPPCHFDASEDALSMADMPLENFFHGSSVSRSVA